VEEEVEEEEQSAGEKLAELFNVEFDNDADPRSTKVSLTAMDQVGIIIDFCLPSSSALSSRLAEGSPRPPRRSRTGVR
jgi:hypothetical protein